MDRKKRRAKKRATLLTPSYLRRYVLKKEKNMKNHFQLIFIVFFLTGCAGSPIHNSFIAPGEIQDTLDYWEGKPVDDAISHYGPPDSVTETNDYKYYKWGVTSGKGLCNWWVKVNSNHIIEDADAKGHMSQCYGAVAFKK